MTYQELFSKWTPAIQQPTAIRFYMPVDFDSLRTNYLQRKADDPRHPGAVSPIERYFDEKRDQVEYVTKANFNFFFKDSVGTFEDLISDLKNIVADQEKVIVEDIANTTSATMWLGKESEVIHEYTQFNTRSNLLPGFGEEDNDFIFNHLAKDDYGNIFYEIEGEYTLLTFKEDSNSRLNSPDFCKDWWEYNKPKMREYDKKILKILNLSSNTDRKLQIEERLIKAGIPKTYLEIIQLDAIYQKEEVTDADGREHIIKKLQHYNIALNNGLDSSKCSFQSSNIIDTLSKRLLVSMDKKKISKRIEAFSNKQGDGIVYIYLPNSSKPIAEPVLTGKWAEFLKGKLNQKIDYLKIAYFVQSVLDTNNYGRQALVISGEGAEGKGLFLEALQLLVGRDVAVAMQASDFGVNDRFGVNKCFLKKLAVLTDCKSVGTLFNEDKFKQLTGGDRLTLEEKFKNPISWANKSFKVAIATNRQYSVSDEYSISRLIPISFKKNYVEDIPKWKLLEGLLSDKSSFLQWCVDYVYWCNKKANGKMIIGNRLTVCNDKDFEVLCNDPTIKIDTTLLLRNSIECELLKGKPCVRLNKFSEEEEEDTNYFIEEIYKDGLVKSSMITYAGVNYLDIVSLFKTINEAYENNMAGSYKGEFFAVIPWKRNTSLRNSDGKKVISQLETAFCAKKMRKKLNGIRYSCVIDASNMSISKDEIESNEEIESKFEEFHKKEYIPELDMM